MTKEVTAQHRQQSLLILQTFWLAQVRRIAQRAMSERTPLQLYPPTDDDYEMAAKLLAEFEPTTSLAVAGVPEELPIEATGPTRKGKGRR